MEHQIYRIIVRKVSNRIRLELQADSDVYATGRSREAAEEELIDKITSKFGDGEPVLNYIEVGISSNERSWWVFRSTEKINTKNHVELYSRGVCARCGVGLGERRQDTAREIDVKIKSDVSFTYNGPVLTHIFSRRIVNILLETGLKSKDLGHVVDANGEQFFEVLGKRAEIQWQPVKSHLGVKIGAQSCPNCKFSTFGFVHLKEKSIRRFISEGDEPKLGGITSIVGTHEPEPVFSDRTREIMRSHKNLSGFIWGGVGLAKSKDIDRNLKFEAFS